MIAKFKISMEKITTKKKNLPESRMKKGKENQKRNKQKKERNIIQKSNFQ